MDRRHMLGGGIVLVTALASVVAAPALPGRLAVHWNASGTADSSLPKYVVLVGFPLLTAGVVGLFESLPHVDPLGENIDQFRAVYDAMAVVTAGFLAYAYGLVLIWNLGYTFEMAQALSPAVAVLFAVVGMLLERAERNWFVGIRTPWTLSSDVVWRHTHDRVAPLFKAASVVALIGVVVPEYFAFLVAGPAVAITVFATVYSYVQYRRIEASDHAAK